MTEYRKPRPVATVIDGPYWEGLRAHEIRVQRCKGCGRYCFPAARICPHCLGEQLDWTQVGGTGRIWSFTVFHKRYFAGFEDEMPYNVAIVELDAGIRVFTNIVGTPNARLEVGLAVRACFDDVADDLTLLKFEPAS